MSGAACQKEVERLHKFFAAWFTGQAKKDPEVLERECTAHLSDDFCMVNPLGVLLSKAQLVTGLHQAYHSHRTRFDIKIHNCQILQNLSKELKLVSYEEWQRTDEQTTARRSTALLKIPSEMGESIQWKYVHETWLEGKGPSEKKASAAAAAAAAAREQPDSPMTPATPETPAAADGAGAVASPAANTRSLVSPRRHISEQLASFAATPIFRGTELVGLGFRGLQIQTIQGPMANEEWMDSTTTHLTGIAQYPGKTRRLILPEVCYSQACVLLRMPNGLVLKWAALDALEEWAKAHQHIDLGSEEEYQGVRVMKSADAPLWKGKQHSNQTDFHYDWTYSTPFSNAGGIWREVNSSGMNLSLLQDTSQPILYFDEIHLFEDDLHDNGVVNFKIKLRIMPTCAYVLSRQWLRVDNLLLRSRECRVMIDFVSQKICRDIQWRQCEWKALEENNLPTDVRPWKNEGQETAAWNSLVNRLPIVKPPTPNHCMLVET